MYFDTPELDSYRSSAHGRRDRFKVRTRVYVEAGWCVLEVKAAGGRGHTVTQRIDYPLEDRARLDGPAPAFLADRNLPVGQLNPTLTTSYRRARLLDLEGSRATLDTGLVCRSPDGRQVSMATRRVLLETKSIGTATSLDRRLWARGIRPECVSKYCTGRAALTPERPANKRNRTLCRLFEWTPFRTSG
ncbi:molecular chaperone [Nakamurella silvestris]|nr:molecular chaperone [Nakamurella silvestris]